MGESNSKINSDDKAGYNQSQHIINSLSGLRNNLIEEKFNKNYLNCLEILISILNVIAGKVPDKKIKEINEQIEAIESKLPEGMKSFTNNYGIWIQNPKQYNEIRKMIDNLHRTLEKLQDEHGYGMGSDKTNNRKVIN